MTRALLDLLAKKGDVAVTVQDEDAVALATSRGTLDEEAIEGTLSRNSGSFRRLREPRDRRRTRSSRSRRAASTWS